MVKPESNHCAKDALTGVFGWFLQFILASLAFTCLILKRFCEPKCNRRPWKIWFYDTSKQGLGALAMHVTNILLSGQFFQGDPCTWYIINFLLDSSVGIFIIYIGIRYCHYLAEQNNWDAINFGEYGKPPSARIWLVQCGLYVFLMFTMKIIITLLMQFSFWENVRDLMLSPITNEYLELALVMLIIPLFVNSLMFWVIDDFLMKRTVEAKRQKGLLQTVKVHYHKLTRHEDNADDDDGILSADDELLGISSSLDNSPVHIDSPNVLVVN
ncbi:store-operated calcium entry regulator STIMATE-like [Lycorma delicatula]|uniref:store-operated calcium entry regulator STIMATE-like n=1 Tax=Lycorma delicatula TaxID=130591 RepID=UPI003F516736